jgi:hypothetical protein
MTFAFVVYKHAATVGAGILPDAETALHIKAAIESLGPEYKVNLHGLSDAAETITAETIDKANAFLAGAGFDPLPADAAKVK